MSRFLNAVMHPKRLLRRTIPRSLFARALLILMTPLILVQIVLGYIFIQSHTDTILTQLSTTIAGDVALVLDWVERDPKAIKSIQTAAQKYMSLNVNFAPQSTLNEY